MELNQDQLDTLSKYFADLSKLLVASSVIGFFIPAAANPVTLPTFSIGAIVAALCLFISIVLIRS